jgi:putative nucleotidyltransferase with HDIG domain
MDTVARHITMTADHKETILFVDDEACILDIASEFFQHKGYRVITAKNGLEAVRILSRERIDCCFTDINMPQMDGLELAQHIHKEDNTIPVIVMTGYPSIDNTIQTLKNGVVDFLIKPVNLNQMEICIRRVLRERQLFIENILLKKEVDQKAELEKLNRELLYKVEELHILNSIMSDFTTVSSSTDVFKRVVDRTIEIARADSAFFYIINDAIEKPFRIARARGKKNAEHRKNNGNGSVPSPPAASTNEDTDRADPLATVIMESIGDDMPLLIAENNGVRGLPQEIVSFVAVPLKIREKVFGTLTAASYQKDFRFTEKDLFFLSFMTQKAAYAIENLALYENIYENLFSTLDAFVKAIEARDSYTQQHSISVTEIALAIGEALDCSKEELEVINCAGRLHDIGKIGIRDDILLKPGKLTSDEYDVIKQHPEIGANIVGQLGLWSREQQIIKHHHERYDGTGYPDGLKGDAIPLLARILAVADAYDAMASDRTYRKKMKTDRILEILREGAGTQFDPNIVDVFLALHLDKKIPYNLQHKQKK